MPQSSLSLNTSSHSSEGRRLVHFVYMPGRERKATRERRSIHRQLREGSATRRPLSPLELRALYRAVASRDPTAFGIRWLYEVELDCLHAVAPFQEESLPSFERRATVIGYAAWRRRQRCVKALLVAGADPTVSEQAPSGALCAFPDEAVALADLLTRRHGHGLDIAVATHVVECVVRMRSIAARDAASGASTPPCTSCSEAVGRVMLFDPCGCVCCESCVWRAVLHGRGGNASETTHLGDVSCPACGAICPRRGHGMDEGPWCGEGWSPSTPPLLLSQAPPYDVAADEGAIGSAHVVHDRPVPTVALPSNVPTSVVGTATAGSVWLCECCFCFVPCRGRAQCRNCLAARPPICRYACSARTHEVTPSRQRVVWHAHSHDH